MVSFDPTLAEPDVVREHLEELCRELKKLCRELPAVIRKELESAGAGHLGVDRFTPLLPLSGSPVKTLDADHQLTFVSTSEYDPSSPRTADPSSPAPSRQQTRAVARTATAAADMIPGLKLRSGRAKEVALEQDEVDLPEGFEGDPDLFSSGAQVVPSETLPTAADEGFNSDGNRSQQDSCVGMALRMRRALRARIYLLVHNVIFDYLSLSLVLLNAVTIGLQTDYSARHRTGDPTPVSRSIDIAFCIAFTSELCLRVFADGLHFFTGPDIKWNMFDCVLVGFQLMDEILSHMASSSGASFNFSFMRVLRLLRLVRIMRVMRILRLIGELRTIVSSIMGSLKSLAWTVVLLFLLVYVFGVYMTQTVLDHRLLGSGSASEDRELARLFGSLPVTILSLYQAISGGIDWADLSTPLIGQVSLASGMVMVFYVAFAILALLNVVTGVFVESALKSAKDDRENYMLHHVRQLFEAVDSSDNGRISWEEFESMLDNKHMKELFNSIDVATSDAEGVFRILDTDDSGEIDLDEFLNGCLGLHGPAKAIHISTLMCETRLIARHHAVQSQLVNSRFSSIAKALRIPEDELETFEAPERASKVSKKGRASNSPVPVEPASPTFRSQSSKASAERFSVLKAPGLPVAPAVKGRLEVESPDSSPEPLSPPCLPGVVRAADVHKVLPLQAPA